LALASAQERVHTTPAARQRTGGLVHQRNCGFAAKIAVPAIKTPAMVPSETCEMRQGNFNV
jgi:hypothetical protein